MELKQKQKEAVVSLLNHVSVYNAMRRSGSYTKDELRPFQNIVLSGYAGTGKSVVIKEVYEGFKKMNYELDKRSMEASMAPGGNGYASFHVTNVAVTAFTGRACENLRERGVPAETSHSLFYEAILDEKGNLMYFRPKQAHELEEDIGDVLIVEEASMMNMDVLAEVIKIGIPIIYVGDDAQLPCIEGHCIFDVLDADEYMYTPAIFLEEIVRTGDNSSIDVFAAYVRETGILSAKHAGPDVEFMDKRNLNLRWLKSHWGSWDVILCGTNRTRKKYNRLVRHACGFHEEVPEVGERVMCLKNSVVASVKINNGELYEVVSRYPGKELSTFQIKKISENGSGNIITVKVDNNMWEEEVRLDHNFSNRDLQDFGYGYALTVHKMQGSSAKNVIFFDEDVSFFLDQTAFRYTGVTRPSERLMVAK